MIDHGSKHLIILSRSAKRNSFITQMEDQGCKVLCIPCDVSDEADLSKALHTCREHMPAIKGVIQAAMVLKVIQTLWIKLVGYTDRNF
jgi:short-subunit dehydrogenase